jgi:predicted RNase H-like HicB family nuclease
MSDGETPEEALVNIRDAILTWIEAAEESGRPIPEPSRSAA